MYSEFYSMSIQPREFLFSLLALLLLSTIVIADPNLNLPDEFSGLNVDAIFDRESTLRKPKAEENKWRERKQLTEHGTNVRWGAISIYENSSNPESLYTNNNKPHDKPHEVIRSPEAAPQLEIRF